MFQRTFKLLTAVAGVLDTAAGTAFLEPLETAGRERGRGERAARQLMCSRAFWQGLLDGRGGGQGSGLLPGMAAACRRLAEQATAQAEQDAVLQELATSAIMCLNPACQVGVRAGMVGAVSGVRRAKRGAGVQECKSGAWGWAGRRRLVRAGGMGLH